MKKIMMTLAAVCVAATMNAQVYVGGSLGFSSEKADYDGAEATTIFSVKPELGYNLDENLAVGIALGFTSEKDGDADALTTFSVAPYLRYTFVKLDKVNLFVDGEVSYATKKDTYDKFGIHIKPGVAVNVNDNISFVAKLCADGLGWSNTKWKNVPNEYKTNKFGVDLSTLGLEFGMYYNF
jgi:hypothetical protein